MVQGPALSDSDHDCQGIPLIWQGQELCENYFLPESGMGRVVMFRPMRWDYFYDPIGKRTIWLTRRLMKLRRKAQFLRGSTGFMMILRDTSPEDCCSSPGGQVTLSAWWPLTSQIAIRRHTSPSRWEAITMRRFMGRTASGQGQGSG